MSAIVGNRDACGRCKTRHGGNDHYCPVHGPCSAYCCEPHCTREEWAYLGEYGSPERRLLPRADLPPNAQPVGIALNGVVEYAEEAPF